MTTLPHHLAELADVAAKAEPAAPGKWAVHPALAQVDAFTEDGPLPVCRLLWPTEERTEAQTFALAKHIAAFNPRTAGALVEIAEAATVVRNWMVTTGHCNGDSHWQYRGLAEALEKLEALAGLGEK